MQILRYKRFWAVYEPSGDLLCVCVYKRGAQAVVERLTPKSETPPTPAPASTLPKQTVRTRKERYDAHAQNAG